jgi:hypothetical protein
MNDVMPEVSRMSGEQDPGTLNSTIYLKAVAVAVPLSPSTVQYVLGPC